MTYLRRPFRLSAYSQLCLVFPLVSQNPGAGLVLREGSGRGTRATPHCPPGGSGP